MGRRTPEGGKGREDQPREGREEQPTACVWTISAPSETCSVCIVPKAALPSLTLARLRLALLAFFFIFSTFFSFFTILILVHAVVLPRDASAAAIDYLPVEDFVLNLFYT